MNLGVVFGSVDTADDMWTQVKTAQHLASKGERVVEVAEQNFSNAAWGNSERYFRRLHLRRMSENYTLVDTTTSHNTTAEIYGGLRVQRL